MADEYGIQKPQPQYNITEMKQKLNAIIALDKERKEAKRLEQEEKDKAAQAKQAEFAQQDAMPSARELALRRTEEVFEPEREVYKEEKQTTAVQMLSGEVILVEDIEQHLDLFVKLKTPEIVSHIDNGKEFYVGTGKFQYHWRQRTEADGDRPEVTGVPKPVLADPKVKTIKHDTFDEWRTNVVNEGADESTHFRGKDTGPSQDGGWISDPRTRSKMFRNFED